VIPAETQEERPTLLLVEDDQTFCDVLSRALIRRGFDVQIATSVEEAIQSAQATPPEYAVLDLNLAGASSLPLITLLKSLDAFTRILVLTGYASIATAVEAIKLGAIHYLTKPADADDIVAAFDREEGDTSVPLSARPLSVNRLEWEHIQKVLLEHDGNISAAARALGMHRRTLQRKLSKRPVKS
jgi:two-component system response regulator RegA